MCFIFFLRSNGRLFSWKQVVSDMAIYHWIRCIRISQEIGKVLNIIFSTTSWIEHNTVCYSGLLKAFCERNTKVWIFSMWPNLSNMANRAVRVWEIGNGECIRRDQICRHPTVFSPKKLTNKKTCLFRQEACNNADQLAGLSSGQVGKLGIKVCVKRK